MTLKKNKTLQALVFLHNQSEVFEQYDFILFFKNSLLLTKPAFIWFKVRQKQ